MEILKFLITMIVMAFGEMFCTLYIISTEERHPFKAALYCSLIVTISTLLTINYFEDKLMIIATIIGAFIGSFLTTKYKK